MNSKINKYNLKLDIFRIILCISVLLYHMNILKGGYLAVCCFFTLSGYLSFKSLDGKRKFSFKKYYKNKFKKLYLPLLIVVGLSIFGLSFYKDFFWVSLKKETLSVLLGYNNFWQIGANLDYFARHISSPFMHFWYIAILLQFDLVFPFIYLLLKKLKEKNRIYPLILSSIITIIFTGLFIYSTLKLPIMVTYYNTLYRVFSILFGVSLGIFSIYFNDYLNKTTFSNKNVFYYIYLIILILLFVFTKSDSNYFGIYMFLSTLISCRIINYTIDNYKENNSKIINIFKYLATLSYEIYLVQYPIIFIVDRYNLDNYLKYIIIIISTIIISIIINYACSIFDKNKDSKDKNNKEKHKSIFNYIISILIFILSIYGLYLFIITEDHTKEMKDLEKQMADNELVMIEKQKEYEEKLKEEETNWENTINSITETENNLASVITNKTIVGVGDSVMLGAVNNLYNKFPNGYFDAQVSRTAWVLPGILYNLRNRNMLGDLVIINLGANGDCPDSIKREIMSIVGDREVFWINVTNDRDVHINDHLKSFSNNYSNLHVLDWNSHSSGHYEYFVADGIHLTESGRIAYTNFIYNEIYNYYLNIVKDKKNKLVMEHESNLKEKYSFYGNDLLLNAYKSIIDKFPESSFIIDNEFNYLTLKEKIEDDIKNNNLSYNVVLVFDSSFKININEYLELIKLFKDNKLYIISVDRDILKLSKDNIKVLDFYNEIKEHNNYLMVDGKHLSNEGNKKLGEFIYNNILNTDNVVEVNKEEDK